MAHANSVFAAYGATVFETMSRLAAAHGAINLGQGFPEGLEPETLIEKLAQTARSGPHQYPPMMGAPALRAAIAAHERRHWGLNVDDSQVMATSGATEALAACFFGLIEPGDEVVLMEPLYDAYLPLIRRAGGVPKLVRLTPPEWALPREELQAAFGPRTRMLVLNSPTNPCGKVFDGEELAFIAGLLERHDCVAICDEVYEHLTYDGRAHISLASLPGMAERCLKIGSAGKIFSLTGWKVGWVVAPPALLTPVSRAHQFLTFAIPAPLQEAVAWGLDNAQDYYLNLAATLSARRDRLAAGLQQAGLRVLPTGGTYFLTTDFSPLGLNGDDWDFCRVITEKAGVAAIPISAFYQAPAPATCARFCFAKTEKAIDEAILRLKAYFCP